MRNFRNLKVWQESITFATEIYKLTESFPDKEKYGLCSQMQRAAVSISSNIAEGSAKRTATDFAKYLDISLGSAFELETQLTIAQQIGYIANEAFEKLLDTLTIIQKQTNQLRTKILE